MALHHDLPGMSFTVDRHPPARHEWTRAARMMIAREEFDTMPPEDTRQAWCTWLRHHTIDPHDVAVPGFIEVDSDVYRISYLTYDLDDRGRRYVVPGEDRVATSVRVMQLEARPSPLPEKAARAATTLGPWDRQYRPSEVDTDPVGIMGQCLTT